MSPMNHKENRGCLKLVSFRSNRVTMKIIEQNEKFDEFFFFETFRSVKFVDAYSNAKF